MTPWRDGDTLRGDYQGRALERNGKPVKHHERCNWNMCDGMPNCYEPDGAGGGWRILDRKRFTLEDKGGR